MKIEQKSADAQMRASADDASTARTTVIVARWSPAWWPGPVPPSTWPA